MISNEGEVVLADRMVDRARRDRLPQDHELYTKAQALENAASLRFNTPGPAAPENFVCAWTRAYAEWHMYSMRQGTPE